MRKRTRLIPAAVGTLLLTLGSAGTVWAQDAPSGAVSPDSGVSATATPGSGNRTVPDPAVRTPQILPDNLTYFIKIAVERIRLALAQNDGQKAELLTEFAEERLAEAFALIREGEPDLAEKSLEEALQDQRLALDVAGGTTGIDQTAAQPADTETTDNTTTSDTVRTGAGSGNSGEPADQNMWNRAAHNIEALSAALQQVGSARAQDAIQRNILRDLDHLKQRLEHWPTSSQSDRSNSGHRQEETDSSANAQSSETAQTNEAAASADDTAQTKAASAAGAPSSSTNSATDTAHSPAGPSFARQDPGTSISGASVVHGADIARSPGEHRSAGGHHDNGGSPGHGRDEAQGKGH
ncbi:MAG: DUF5667 domain-containing protein [Kyrpidia sp.]|nr:DUF5667 domain-containing protein [Kyrpidia sp.]